MELASTWLARVFLRRDVNAPPEPSCTTRIDEGGADDVFRALESLSSRECILVDGFNELVRNAEAVGPEGSARLLTACLDARLACKACYDRGAGLAFIESAALVLTMDHTERKKLECRQGTRSMFADYCKRFGHHVLTVSQSDVVACLAKKHA